MSDRVKLKKSISSHLAAISVGAFWKAHVVQTTARDRAMIRHSFRRSFNIIIPGGAARSRGDMFIAARAAHYRQGPTFMAITAAAKSSRGAKGWVLTRSILLWTPT